MGGQEFPAMDPERFLFGACKRGVAFEWRRAGLAELLACTTVVQRFPRRECMSLASTRIAFVRVAFACTRTHNRGHDGPEPPFASSGPSKCNSTRARCTHRHVTCPPCTAVAPCIPLLCATALVGRQGAGPLRKTSVLLLSSHGNPYALMPSMPLRTRQLTVFAALCLAAERPPAKHQTHKHRE